MPKLSHSTVKNKPQRTCRVSTFGICRSHNPSGPRALLHPERSGEVLDTEDKCGSRIEMHHDDLSISQLSKVLELLILFTYCLKLSRGSFESLFMFYAFLQYQMDDKNNCAEC